MTSKFNPDFQRFAASRIADYQESREEITDTIILKHGKSYADNVRMVYNLTAIQETQIGMFCGNVPMHIKERTAIEMAEVISEVAAKLCGYVEDTTEGEIFIGWVLTLLKHKAKTQDQLSKEYFKNYKED